MKKIMLMLATWGTLVTMQAQVMQKPVGQKTPIYNTEVPEILPQTPFFLNGNVIVPEKVKTSFRVAYGNVDATWKKQGNDFKATFKSKDRESLETIVLYDANGGVLLKEKELLSNAGPVAISKYCDQHALGKTSRVWEVDSKGGTRKYFLVHKGETVWFDNNGSRMSSNDAQMAHHKVGSTEHKTKVTGHKKTVKHSSSTYYK